MLSRMGLICFVILTAMSVVCVDGSTKPDPSLAIISPSDASYMETLAASEIRRYVYQRTGVLVPIVSYAPSQAETSAIIVARCDRSLAGGKGSDLQAQQYLLQTIQDGSNRQVWIIGGDDAGTLYGAYRFAEHLGIRFYMHGDLIPDEKIDLQLPDLDETGKPLFEVRGIQPFHDFPEGPDWWNEDEYKAIFSQLPKLRMNFFGLHTYPEDRPNAEPTVWIGLPRDIGEDGAVRFSYPSSYQNTLRGNWGYVAKRTCDYTFGAADLFEFDAYGPNVMGTSFPYPKDSVHSNSVFNRTGRQLRDTFSYARRLGIKTCVGTETPLIIPKQVQERLKALGKDPADPAVVGELYEGMFKRIMDAYPVDYYWFWTPEGWIWSGVQEEEITATTNDLLVALQAAKNVGAPFTLATCGWVLGPESDRSLFDRILPKEMPLSCINREVGKAPVQRAFAKIKDRPLWAIPWMEDDPSLLNAQLWVGRMRADAVDALDYGCNGLLGIHWRTRILGPNVSALAAAAWEQGEWGQVDSGFHQGEVEGPIGGYYLEKTSTAIEKTEDDPLYQTARKDVAAYRLQVPNGTYHVTLGFCELEGPNSRRMFSVSLQEKNVLSKLVLLNKAGENTALDYSFSDIQVTDGWLKIGFEAMQNAPCISAISVTSDTFSKKINCGGPAFGDYQADWPAFAVKPRHLQSGDFYQDWAEHMFGSSVADSVAAIFEKLDGKFPCPSEWIDGPGGLRPDTRSWDDVQKEYEFVATLQQLQSKVKGSGNCERFDYWLRNFQFMQALAKTRCIWGQMKQAEEQVKKQEDAFAKTILIHKEVLPLAQQAIDTFGEAYKILLPSISNSGELGTVANLEQHVKDLLITRTEKQLSELSGETITLGEGMSMDYEGPSRLIVPTVRTTVSRIEPFFLKAILLDRKEPRDIALYWRGMGEGEFQRVPLTHMRRGVYKVEFPLEALTHTHLEYYVKVRSGSGKTLYFPATAPELNQTVVVMPEMMDSF